MTIPITIADQETPASDLVVSAESSNADLAPASNLVFGGSGSQRTLAIMPLPNQSGTATITVTISDGQATIQDDFVLTVNAVNDAPTISVISDQETEEDIPWDL